MLRKKVIREGGRKSEGGGYLKQEIKPKRPYQYLVHLPHAFGMNVLIKVVSVWYWYCTDASPRSIAFGTWRYGRRVGESPVYTVLYSTVPLLNESPVYKFIRKGTVQYPCWVTVVAITGLTGYWVLESRDHF